MDKNDKIKVGLFRQSDNALTFRAGDVIFNEGDIGREMFVVRKGRVELRIGNLQLDVVEADETFGELALIDQQTRSATATALTDCEVVPVDSQRFLFLVQQTPNFALLMLKILASRLRRMDSAAGYVKDGLA